jgi:hypothetical protein
MKQLVEDNRKEAKGNIIILDLMNNNLITHIVDKKI